MTHIQLDKWGGDDSFGDRAVTQLHALTDSLNLEDFYRVKFPTGPSFTWFNGPHTVGCRLDRFYTPKGWRSRITDFKCHPFGYSDHHLISLKLTLGNSNLRGQGIWIFNTQLLKSEPFCTAVKHFWPACQEHRPAFTDPRNWWDAGKLQLKELAISHSIEQSRERRGEKSNLEHEFQLITSRGDSNTAADHPRLAEIKDLLKTINDRAVEGAMMRSIAQWIEMGEKPTKYLTPVTEFNYRITCQQLFSHVRQKYSPGMSRFLQNSLHCQIGQLGKPRLALRRGVMAYQLNFIAVSGAY